MGCLPHDILPRVLGEAFGELHVRVEARANKRAQSLLGVDVDAALEVELNWHKLVGSRLKLTLLFIQDPQELEIVIVLALVSEPGRYFTKWLLDRSSVFKSSKAPVFKYLLLIRSRPFGTDRAQIEPEPEPSSSPDRFDRARAHIDPIDPRLNQTKSGSSACRADRALT